VAEEKNDKEITQQTGISIKFIAICLILFLATIGGSYFAIKTALAPLLPSNTVTKGETGTIGNLIDLGEFTVNVLDVSMARYLKTEIVIEVSDDKVKKEIEANLLPVLRDEVISILSSKTLADLDSRHRNELKKEIKDKLNKRLNDAVSNVYFDSFITQ